MTVSTINAYPVYKFKNFGSFFITFGGQLMCGSASLPLIVTIICLCQLMSKLIQHRS